MGTGKKRNPGFSIMQIKVLRSALKDLIEGYRFYEMQQNGLGVYFLEALSADIESLKLFAGTHGIYLKKYYRLLSKRFPFAVYYRIEGNEIRIYAVVDCRKDPAWTREKLQ